MKGARKIGVDELDSMVSGLDRRPYLLIVANKTQTKMLAATEGIQALDEFNQKEIMRDRTPVFVLRDADAFRPSWKGFMWVFTMGSMKDLNPAIPDMVQVHIVT